MSRQFSARLMSLRAGRGLSQRRVATDLGISQALLSHYENGLREPGLEFVVKACDYYGVSADYMLGRAEEGYKGRADDGYNELKRIVEKLNELAAEASRLIEEP